MITIMPLAYEVTIYHDLPDEAAVDARCIGWEDERGVLRSLAAARGFADRAAGARGWAMWSATIEKGQIVERQIEGARLREFANPTGTRWWVGPTWCGRDDVVPETWVKENEEGIAELRRHFEAGALLGGAADV